MIVIEEVILQINGMLQCQEQFDYPASEIGSTTTLRISVIIAKRQSLMAMKDAISRILFKHFFF